VTNKAASQEMHQYRALFTRHDLGVLSPPSYWLFLIPLMQFQEWDKNRSQADIGGVKKPAKAGLISSHFKLILNGKSA